VSSLRRAVQADNGEVVMLYGAHRCSLQFRVACREGVRGGTTNTYCNRSHGMSRIRQHATRTVLLRSRNTHRSHGDHRYSHQHSLGSEPLRVHSSFIRSDTRQVASTENHFFRLAGLWTKIGRIKMGEWLNRRQQNDGVCHCLQILFLLRPTSKGSSASYARLQDELKCISYGCSLRHGLRSRYRPYLSYSGCVGERCRWVLCFLNLILSQPRSSTPRQFQVP